jgi:hypothetical protein
VQAALQSALRAAGLAWGLYELNHGLVLALDRNRRGAAWCAGQDSLAEAGLAFDSAASARHFDALLAT